jgi:hypothetical protein
MSCGSGHVASDLAVASPSCYVWASPVLGPPPAGSGSNRDKILVKVVSACRRSKWLDRYSAVLVTDDRDGELAWLQWTALGGWPRSRTHGGLQRLAGAANCPGFVPRRPPPCAAAVRRAAAAWCGGFPAGASRPLSAVAPALSARVVCAVTRR